MLSAPVFNMDGSQSGQIDLMEEVFDVEPNLPAVHEAVVAYLANQRHGTHSTKTRTEVRGGGIKPWRQKGTGRARQGSIRAPQWTGGGIVFGPKPRSHSVAVNRKVKVLALKSALSDKFRSGDIVFVEDFTLQSFSTKAVILSFRNLNVEGCALVVLANADKAITNSTRNIAGSDASFVGRLNTYEILNHKRCILTRGAVKALGEVYVS
jgi:large subunit ribosomal protein L4